MCPLCSTGTWPQARHPPQSCTCRAHTTGTRMNLAMTRTCRQHKCSRVLQNKRRVLTSTCPQGRTRIGPWMWRQTVCHICQHHSWCTSWRLHGCRCLPNRAGMHRQMWQRRWKSTCHSGSWRSRRRCDTCPPDRYRTLQVTQEHRVRSTAHRFTVDTYRDLDTHTRSTATRSVCECPW